MIIKDLVYGLRYGDLEIDTKHPIIIGQRKDELIIDDAPIIYKSLPSGRYYGYIYVIICLYNDPSLGDKNPYYKKYIGKCGIGYSLENYFGSGKYIKRDIKKYGIENFVKIVFEYIDTKANTNELEKYYITLLRAKERKDWYNIKDGGDTWNGDFIQYYEPEDKKKHSNKISKSSKERWAREEYKDKMSAIHKVVQNLPENVSHQREIQTYVQNLPEVKEKNRQSQIRRYSNPDERIKASLIQIENWNKDPSRREFQSKITTERQLGWSYVIVNHKKVYWRINENDMIEWYKMYSYEEQYAAFMIYLKRQQYKTLNKRFLFVWQTGKIIIRDKK